MAHSDMDKACTAYVFLDMAWSDDESLHSFSLLVLF